VNLLENFGAGARTCTADLLLRISFSAAGSTFGGDQTRTAREGVRKCHSGSSFLIGIQPEAIGPTTHCIAVYTVNRGQTRRDVTFVLACPVSPQESENLNITNVLFI
jgi:hypothetical protein